jgi:EAL domain-containing protein (putative c-di-GMP-specific phosphodiesterase class I)
MPLECSVDTAERIEAGEVAMLSAHADWFLCGVAESDSRRAVVRVDRMPFVIGRRPGLNLTLDSLCVSGRHAELSARGERLFVADLGSRNGTQVNGKRIRSSPLGVGDLLKVGDVEFRLDRRPRNDAKGRTAPAPADFDTMQLHWLGAQFEELISGTALTAELRPIVQLCDESVAAYEARGQSQLAGLETEARMCEAARLLGREKELNQLLLRCCECVVGNVPAGCWLLLRTPAAVNLASEVVPVLQALRARAPQSRIVVEVVDAPLRSLRSLNDFVATLKALDVQLALGNFAWEHMRFLQSSRLLPLAVRFAPGLTQNLATKSEPERKRLKTMVGSLHQYRIRSIAPDIDTPDDARACEALDIDFAVGLLFDELLAVPAKPLLDTCVLASDLLSALNNAPPASPEPAGRNEAEQGMAIEEAHIAEPAADRAPPDPEPVDESAGQLVTVDELSADEQPADELPVDELPVDEMPVDEMPVDEMPVDEMPVDESLFDDVPPDDLPAEECAVFELWFDEVAAPPDEPACSSDVDPSHEMAASDEVAPLEELVLPDALDFPDAMPGESDVSVLEEENDITADLAVDFGSVSFRLPPPRRP